ncbi:hypothetical protein [Sphingosinicella sp.]|uniref:hypothetical protein n=1 Tax=Sphingosinicella sp. TaxID=1917971 RepID=UPI0040379C0A
MAASLSRPILVATLVAGTLDILAATILSLIFGRGPAAMLRFVASGPFPAASEWGAAGAALGLAVHFAIMAVMVAIYVAAAGGIAALREKPLLWGTLYGLATYVVMNLVVVPLRFEGAFPPSPRGTITQLFCHIVLVGLPIALIASRHFRRPAGHSSET